jgi:hypothetical protein
MCQDPLPPFDFYTWPAAVEAESARFAVQPSAVIDLTPLLAKDGSLTWQVPAGDWIILRTELVPTGTKNSPAPPEATGLEVDKMSRAAVQSHFNTYISPLLKKLRPAERKSWTHIIADSYEAGPQNWTDHLASDFQKHYGYDPIPYLPVMSGRTVGSADQSDRFLWDLRRLIADRIASEYVGGLRDLCHQAGLKLWLENYGHWGFPAEFLQYGGQSDEIGGEFWVNSDLGGPEIRAAASAAHTYGKRTVWAEAFTGGPSFTNAPRDLKALGDWAFAEGVNQFVFHVAIHQPWDDKKPGINAWFGTEFNRHNTWFSLSRPWIDYLRRCSVMLQTGHHVADVAYFIGEDTPKMIGSCNPALPAGYDYDYINAEVIEKHLRVKNGRLVLPDGMSYRLLVLPDSATMRPAVLKKIGQLVAAGAAVLGPAPSRSPSLARFPTADAEVQSLAQEIWQDDQVMTNLTLEQAFAKLDLSPAITLPADIRWKHRSDGRTDLYFLANPLPTTRTETISFRVHDRVPELWFPETGKIQPLTDFHWRDGRLHVPVSFSPHGSVFVVFRKARTTDHYTTPQQPLGLHIVDARYSSEDGTHSADVTARLASATHEGRLDLPNENDTLGGDPAPQQKKQLTVQFTHAGIPGKITLPEHARLQLPIGPELRGPWRVSIDGNESIFPQLLSWSDHPDAAIKYFSGTAKYTKTIFLSEISAPIQLDLGTVHSIATIRVNGRTIATLWKEPYIAVLNPALRKGKNLVEIEVTHTWHNRLVGDQQSGISPRTFTTTNQFHPHTPLQHAGLLGPVRLIRQP